MTDDPFGYVHICAYIERVLAVEAWTELEGVDRGPYLSLRMEGPDEQPAGCLRIWRAPDTLPLDRMVHLRLIAGPVETNLLFVFGRSDTTMPHLHAQVVQFPPDGCVYNMDLLPRLDPVDHPEWFDRVFGPLRRAYRKATSDRANSCAQAPANPALAVYMSPWGIASGRADAAEFTRLAPTLDEYLDHYLSLMSETGWESPAGMDIADRDRRHLAMFFADELDPRAWNGVYKVVGESTGQRIKRLFRTPLKTQA
jgi:hypothetical protein